MARGRKVSSDGEVTRSLLFEKAIEQFAQDGYHATKISDIVKKANVTQPTFYLYFTSKEAIFNEITLTFQKQLLQLTTESILEEKLENRFLKRLTKIFTFFGENPLLTKIGFFEADSASGLKDIMVQQITESLESEKNKGHLTDMYLVATSLVGSIERLVINEILNRQSNPRELAERLVEIYFTGIQK